MEGFEPERWAFWRERFRWVGVQRGVEVKKETRTWARRALERMEELERTERPRRGFDRWAVESGKVV